MITKILPLQFLKKSPFYGSYEHMRYRLMKVEDQLNVCIYPGPFSFDATPEIHKRFQDFPFSEEGYEEALSFLNTTYDSTDWAKAALDFFETEL